MYGQKTISLRPLAALASAIAGRPLAVRWGSTRQIYKGGLGHYGWVDGEEEIRLSVYLGRFLDKRLAWVFWHELGHALLPDENKTPEQREDEANRFMEAMMARGGEEIFFWLLTMLDGLSEGQADGLIEDVREVCESVRASKLLTRIGGSMKQRGAMSDAAWLEGQARTEEALAAKVEATNPTLAAKIRNSAVGKRESAMALRGAPVGKSKYESRVEHCVATATQISIAHRS